MLKCNLTVQDKTKIELMELLIKPMGRLSILEKMYPFWPKSNKDLTKSFELRKHPKLMLKISSVEFRLNFKTTEKITISVTTPHNAKSKAYVPWRIWIKEIWTIWELRLNNKLKKSMNCNLNWTQAMEIPRLFKEITNLYRIKIFVYLMRITEWEAESMTFLPRTENWISKSVNWWLKGRIHQYMKNVTQGSIGLLCPSKMWGGVLKIKEMIRVRILLWDQIVLYQEHKKWICKLEVNQDMMEQQADHLEVASQDMTVQPMKGNLNHR